MAQPIRIVHLVWAPLGVSALREFLGALDEHPPGAPHELSVVLNGFESVDETSWLDLLAGRDAGVIRTPEPYQDLGAYGCAAAAVEEDLVCLMNSYARPLREGWLALLAAAVASPSVTAAAATGSWESHATELRMVERWRISETARDKLGGFYDWFRYRGLFPRFPNPHLRTNGLLCPRELIVDTVREPPRTKPEAFVLESGRRGITKRAGDRVVVVGIDGNAYSPHEWPASKTFRAGEQENLLIADNRTEDWHRAGVTERTALALRAWGPGSDLGTPAG